MKRTWGGWTIVAVFLCNISGPLWASDKFPTQSCQDRNNLRLMHRCNPYNASFFFVQSSDLPPAPEGKHPLPEKSVSQVEAFHYKAHLTLSALVERYIEYKEKFLQRQALKKEKRSATIERKQSVSLPREKKKEPGKERSQGKKNEISQRRVSVSSYRETLEKLQVLSSQRWIQRWGIEEMPPKSDFSGVLPSFFISFKKANPSISLAFSYREILEKLQALSSQHWIQRWGIEEMPPKSDSAKMLPPPIIEETFSLLLARSQALILHHVEKGDTFLRLARKYRTTVYDLKRWNGLKADHLLKIGEHLKVYPSKKTPPEKIKEAEIRALSGRYKVVRGDTLIGIARRFDVDRKEIKRLNGLGTSSHLRLGTTLLLPVSQKKIDRILAQEKKRRKLKRKERLKREYAFKYLGDKRFKHKLRVIATAYTSHRGQTDKTPFLAAWNNRIRPGMKIIAVSSDLIRRYGIGNGTRVKISGLPGTYVVRDKMHHKWRRRIDIYMGVNRRRALRWGRRSVLLYW